MAAKTVTTGIKLDGETKDRLKTLGEKRDRSPHYLMREAIAQYLDREESIEEERRLTLERWERYERTGVAVDHETVSNWIDDRIAGKSAPWPIPDD